VPANVFSTKNKSKTWQYGYNEKYDSEDELAADRLKNAAATKKLAIFDAFEILKRIEDEKQLLNGVDVNKNNTPKGFAESRSK
jgi:hypothetical protein